MHSDFLDGLWKRPQLSPRDRSIVTLSVLITLNQTLDLPFYLRLALDSGLKPAEILEIVIHLAFYAGLGNASATIAIVKDVFGEHGIGTGDLPPANPKLLPSTKPRRRRVRRMWKRTPDRSRPASCSSQRMACS